MGLLVMAVLHDSCTAHAQNLTRDHAASVLLLHVPQVQGWPVTAISLATCMTHLRMDCQLQRQGWLAFSAPRVW